MGIYLIVAGIVLAALGLAAYSNRRKREAETASQQSNAMLSDFMTTDLMLKNSAFNSYKAMMRQPQPAPPQTEFAWETRPGDRRRF